MKTVLVLASAILIVIVAFSLFFGGSKEAGEKTITGLTVFNVLEGKKVLWVDSYNEGFPWADGTLDGIKSILYDTAVELEIYRMDNKEHPGEADKIASGKEAKEVFDRVQPDVVIASDDIAQEYFVVPYLKGGDVPVIFTGVNWDASSYGYPTETITGMVEVEPLNELLDYMKEYSNGNKLVFLSADSETERKIVEIYEDRFFYGGLDSVLVDNYDEFESEFLRLQEEYDMIYFGSYGGISGWDDDTAEKFLLENTKVVTGSRSDYMSKFVLITVGKIPEEQGEYAAMTALNILNGESPVNIPVVTNKKSVVILNLKIAEKMHVDFSPYLIKIAEFIE